MDWQRTYPPLATVMEASFETLCTWCEHLPAPETDVQRTVLRRLKARRDELMALQVREKAPHIADKFNDIIDRMERLGIKSPVKDGHRKRRRSRNLPQATPAKRVSRG